MPMNAPVSLIILDDIARQSLTDVYLDLVLTMALAEMNIKTTLAHVYLILR